LPSENKGGVLICNFIKTPLFLIYTLKSPYFPLSASCAHQV